MKIYELTPTTGQNQASFHGKAKVVEQKLFTATTHQSLSVCQMER